MGMTERASMDWPRPAREGMYVAPRERSVGVPECEWTMAISLRESVTGCYASSAT